MANRVYLFNTERCVRNPYRLPEDVTHHGYALAASLARVQENLRAARPVFEKVVGEPRLARAAEGGHAESACTLGRILQGTQPGVIDLLAVQYAGPGEHPRRPGESHAWFLKATQAGCREPMAWLLLGEMSFNGDGTAQDHEAAARWLRLAADAGHDKAQMWMAIACYHGFGVPKDPRAGREWMEEAAAQGFEPAHVFLAIPAWKFWARRGFFTGLA